MGLRPEGGPDRLYGTLGHPPMLHCTFRQGVPLTWERRLGMGMEFRQGVLYPRCIACLSTATDILFFHDLPSR
jgi:hypothetical protein